MLQKIKSKNFVKFDWENKASVFWILHNTNIKKKKDKNSVEFDWAVKENCAKKNCFINEWKKIDLTVVQKCARMS